MFSVSFPYKAVPKPISSQSWFEAFCQMQDKLHYHGFNAHNLVICHTEVFLYHAHGSLMLDPWVIEVWRCDVRSKKLHRCSWEHKYLPSNKIISPFRKVNTLQSCICVTHLKFKIPSFGSGTVNGSCRLVLHSELLVPLNPSMTAPNRVSSEHRADRAPTYPLTSDFEMIQDLICPLNVGCWCSQIFKSFDIVPNVVYQC